LTPDGRQAVTLPVASYDGRVNLWDLERGGEPRTLRLGGDVRAAVLTPDGRRLLASSRRVDPTSGLDGRLEVRDLDGGGPERLLAQDEPMTRLAVSRDGRWLVCCSAGGAVEVWDLVALERVASFMADNAVTVCAVAALADGVLVVAGDAGGEVHVLDLVN
ncbi:MAG TPA: hypothetical protein VFS70_22925, partial [Actinomycetota bacterium]|nr:hypothetical protein [Actinomycetota bacterium]